MSKIWNGFWNWFSNFGFIFFFIGALFGFLYIVIKSDTEKREETKIAAQTCYSRGMIVAETDAGKACVDPRTLVILK